MGERLAFLNIVSPVVCRRAARRRLVTPPPPYRSVWCVSSGCYREQALAPTKFALVIGNDAYNNGVFGLAHAMSSAAAIAKRLTSLGYSVVLKQNTSLDRTQAAFKAFRDQLSAGCSAVIYFCGHGWQDAVYADCLLAPVDFDDADSAGMLFQLHPLH